MLIKSSELNENDEQSDNEDLTLEPAAEMDKDEFPMGASMPVTDLYRRKHKTDSKSKRPPELLHSGSQNVSPLHSNFLLIVTISNKLFSSFLFEA